MKELYFSLVALFMCLCASSQIVNIPDADFKAILLEASPSNEIAKNLSGLYFKIDANNDSEIQVSEAIEVKQLNISGVGRNITSLVGILNFTNLEILNCNALHCPTLNLSGMSSLHQLNCWQSGIDTLNLTGLSGLEILFCGGNNFTELDLRGFGLTNLTLLECANSQFLTNVNVNGLNSLENLMIGGNPIMTGLHCSQNQLATLSLADLPSLSTLECADNLLTTLNLNSYPGIQNLNCSGNRLSSLFIKNGITEGNLDMSDNPDLLYVCTDTAQMASVQALITSYGYANCIVSDACSLTPDIVTISDLNFKLKLLEANPSNFIAKNLNGNFFKIDANNDSEIQVNEALQVSYLDVQHDFSSPDNPFITSLDGILSFTNLQELNCANNQLAALNMSGLGSLVKLDCSLNQLASINLTGLTNLQELITAGTGNQFGSLNLSGLNNLRILICAFNGLSSLNVNGLTNLRTLSCGFNNFTTLDVSTLTNLEELYCSSAGLLTSLDVTGLANLRELGCSDNFNLQEIHCSQNQLTALNLNGLPNITTLEITDNLLTSLNVNSLTSLQNLDCSGNQLTSLQIKNGVSEGNLNFDDNPGLLYVCADAAQIATVQSLVTSYGYVNCVVDALCSSGNPNVVVIPDASFKATLLASSPLNQIAKNLNGDYFAIDSNGDTEIQQSEAEQVSSLDVKFSGIASMEGISSFTNLNYLNCRGNMLTELHVGGLTNLQVLRCSNNFLTSLDLNGITNLRELHCSNNQLTALNAADFPNLEVLHIENNLLTTFDANSLLNLTVLHVSGNQLTSLFIKNGSAEELEVFGNTGLAYICVDDFQLSDVEMAVNMSDIANCNINSYCSFVPGGTVYTIHGNNKIDFNANGCDAADMELANPKFSIASGATSNTIIGDASGEYNLSLEAGTYTITPVLENPAYFNISPSAVTFTFPAQSSPFNIPFCYTPNGIHHDLEVSMIPTSAAVPGFSAQYVILFKNKGNYTQSGTVTIFFDETSNIGSMPLNFTDLKPLESRAIYLSTGINSPTDTPPVNAGDVLNYLVTISSPMVDETPEDNTFELNQTVVNSMDPNDKTCLEGATISPSEVGKYMHYMIRFENTGTYQAQNIVVKDMIDTDKFDINSLIPLKGSHNFVTRIKENKVEFIFENINLPFDDANNDGYVVFKIKTKPTLANGDTFSNSASIYFDYNFPVETNMATTTIQALSNQDFSFSDYFIIYPNPVKDVLTIETSHEIKMNSVSIYNQLGQLVLVVPNAENVSKVDVSNLASGNYFIKINSDKGTSNTKFIKQ